MFSSAESECPRERQMVIREFSQAAPLSNPMRASVYRMLGVTNRSRRRKAERRRSRQQNTYAFLSTVPSLSNTYPRHPRVTISGWTTQFGKPAVDDERFQSAGKRLSGRCGSEMHGLQKRRENAPYPSPASLQLLIAHVIRRTYAPDERTATSATLEEAIAEHDRDFACDAVD
jgi:hypothetical protein